MAPEAILYSFRRCPYAMRARLAIAVSKTQCELREVKLSAKPEAMVTASPKATVPVLVLPDSRVVDESLDIMRWALTANDPEDWLSRDDAALIARNDSAFKRDLDRYKYPDRHGVDPMVHRAGGVAFLQALEDRLTDAGYLCGQKRGLTDAAIMPFVRQFAAVDTSWFETLPLIKVQSWLTRQIASPLFETVMLRVKPWAQGDEPITFPGL